MENKITVEHIIAKIDNDFNPDNSDWIPRVAAWCVDAMNQLKVLRTVDKKRTLTVNNRIAKSACCLGDDVRIYDSNGCEIARADKSCNDCNNSPTGGQECAPNGSGTREVIVLDNPEYATFAEHVNTVVERERHNVTTLKSAPRRGRNYVIDGLTIELNFDDTSITIVNKEVETKYSDYYHCDVPVIPNNGILAEALAYYCMYKMLCRGYKHPVFNLAASQYGTNPYYMWMQLKEKAKTSITLDQQGDDNGAWRRFFANSMLPFK